MRLIFMGTPEFAVETLKNLIDKGHEVLAVVTSPDKPAGRGKNVQESAVKTFAKQKQIPVLQPEKLKSKAFIAQLKDFDAELFVVVAFRMLPEVVWSMPPKGTINLHASLLPNYRGAAPINWAIINGEKETGVTTFIIEKEIDTGKILLQERVAIYNEMTAGELHDKLMILGAELVSKTLDSLNSNTLVAMDQSVISLPSLPLKAAPKLFKENCRIAWDTPTESIYNFIRGLSPYPSAWTVMKFNEKKDINFKILKSTNDENSVIEKQEPGEISTDGKNFLKVSSALGSLSILELQQEGKKRMPIADFLKGFKFEKDAYFL